MAKEEFKKSLRRNKFDSKYGNLNESEIQKELLFAQQLTIEKLEAIRSNTSTLIVFLIVIPILLGILMGILAES